MLPARSRAPRPGWTAAVLLLASSLLTGCGGADDPGSPTSSSATPTPGAADGGGTAFNMTLLANVAVAALTEGRTARGSGNWGYTAPDGRRFALTGTSVGLSVEEVSEPTRPRHVGFIGGPDSNWREVKTYRDVAYVTTEARHGLDVIDLGTPDRPALVQTWSETFASAHTLCIDSARGLLFANGTRDIRGATTGMRILSLEPDPRTPREIGSFGSFYIHDCVVRGTTLYASAINEGFLAVLDIADPANVREVTRFSTGRRFTHNSWPTVDGRFLFTTDEVPNAPLEGWDIADPTRPVKVSEYIGRAGTTPHNVLVDGTRLLVAHYTEGVHLLDITVPARPRLLGRYDTFTTESPGTVFDGVWGAYIFPGTDLIVASDMANGLFVLANTGR